MRLHSIRPAPQTQCGQTSAVRPVVHRSSFNGERPEVAASPNLSTGDHYWIAYFHPNIGLSSCNHHLLINIAIMQFIHVGLPHFQIVTSLIRWWMRPCAQGNPRRLGLAFRTARFPGDHRECPQLQRSSGSGDAEAWLQAWQVYMFHFGWKLMGRIKATVRNGVRCASFWSWKRSQTYLHDSAWLKIDLKKDAFLHATTLNPFFLRL